MYAVIEAGGKQYRVAPGEIIEVDRLPVEQNSTVELNKVLLISHDEKVIVGNPVIKGAKVVAEALGEKKGNKIIVFKYKPKVRYRKKTGHRQTYTRLNIKQILLKEGSS